ncbi:MAG: tRNA lysidine(34) synthetase TilS [Bacillota bacterium]
MIDSKLLESIGGIVAGGYAVAVSGGADSVALLHLLHHHRTDLRLHVVHLDHQTRGEASTGDAAFVGELARQWGLACTIRRRDQIEPEMPGLPANKSARYRAIRYELFRRVVAEQGLRGVLLAHHADDQAETILHRLLRGMRAPHLVGILPESRLGDLLLLRPLLGVSRQMLREYLAAAGQSWREDASNASLNYFRNRLRYLLKAHPQLTEAMLEGHQALAELRAWVRSAAPKLDESFPVSALQDLPGILADAAARRWLLARGVPHGELAPGTVEQLMTMANDAASPARQHFPGRIAVRRRAGRVFVDGMAPPIG